MTPIQKARKKYLQKPEKKELVKNSQKVYDRKRYEIIKKISKELLITTREARNLIKISK